MRHVQWTALAVVALLSCGMIGETGRAAAESVLVTQLSGKKVFKIDPLSDAVTAQLSFSGNPGRPAVDVSRRIAYLPLNDQLVVLRPDTMEAEILTVAGLGKDGSFAALSPDGKNLALVNHGADGLRSADDRLDVVTLDPDAWPPTATLLFSLPVGQQPIRALIDHNGKYAVVSVRDAAKILVVDLASRQVALQLSLTPGAEPEGMDLHPVRNIAYVTLHGQNRIEVLDLAADPPQHIRSVPIQSHQGNPQPSGGNFNPDGSRFYVSGQVTNEILLFDTSNAALPVQNTAISLSSAQQPHDIVFLSDGRAYVANTFNMQPHGSISVIEHYDGSQTLPRQILSDVILNPLYLAVVPSSAGYPTAGIAVNQASFSPGDRMTVTLTTRPGSSDARWNAYAALFLPDGSHYFLSLSPVPGFSLTPVPLYPPAPMTAGSSTLLDFVVPTGLSAGNWAWAAILATPDMSSLSELTWTPFTVSDGTIITRLLPDLIQ